MYYLVDSINKVIFGWSAKCGCTHIKNLFFYLTNENPFFQVHRPQSYCKLPSDYSNYNIIIITRNPYDRLVSGFKDKYMEQRITLEGYDTTTLTFNEFTTELLNNGFAKINFHHFTRQLSEEWNDELINISNNIKYYDINFVDYDYISSLYNGAVIPDNVKNFKGPHSTQTSNIIHQDKVYNEPYSVYKDKKVNPTLFYNDEIQERVYKIFQKDFVYFESIGIKYDLGSTLVNQSVIQTEELKNKFTFIHGKDQPGYDCHRLSPISSIRVMLLETLSSSNYKGTNTLGFIKSKIDKDALEPSIYFNKNDGIYIKNE